MSIFSGIWVPLVTPFDHDRVDHRALARLVSTYLNAGPAGLVALGTTGEPSSLSEAERQEVLATILDVADGTPVMVGVAGNNTVELRERVLSLNEQAIAGILVPAPYYVRPSQAGLIAHFTSLADLSVHPLVLYDIPYRTGVRMELPTLLSLAAHPNIRAIKDCGGSIDTTLALILDGRLSVLCGEDIHFFSTLCLGGQGAIAATAHLRCDDFVAVYRALEEGKIDQARRQFQRLVPLIQALTSEPNPAPVKCALETLGVIRHELRAPMTGVSEPLRDRLEALLKA